MPPTTITVGEFLYDYTARLTKSTDYGVDMEAIAAGKMPLPPEGARSDGAFEGAIEGPKLKGTFTGIDYFHVRADGRAQVHLHAEITTDDGEKISLFSEGIATPGEGAGLYQLRENASLITSSPAYSWVNHLLIWCVGSADLTSGEIKLKAYAA